MKNGKDVHVCHLVSYPDLPVRYKCNYSRVLPTLVSVGPDPALCSNKPTTIHDASVNALYTN